MRITSPKSPGIKPQVLSARRISLRSARAAGAVNCRWIVSVSQKMLIQQLRQLESDGVVRRIVHHQVPPRVEYGLTDWGEALCPALDELLKWAASREDYKSASSSEA